jgi:thiamine transport system permease protein
MTSRRLNTFTLVRPALRILLCLFLISPYLVWLAEIQDWSLQGFSQAAQAFQQGSMQALASTVLSVFFGFALFLSLQSVQRHKNLAELSLLLPNMLPPLFLVLTILTLPFVEYPLGLRGVIAAHVFLNSGLVAVALDRIFTSRLAGLAEAAYVMSASRWHFLLEVAWPILKRDIGILCLFIFAVCFTSFSIPLLLTTSRTATIELVIYDFIRVQGRWDKAVLLAAAQTLFLLLLSWIARASELPKARRASVLQILRSQRIGWLVWLPSFVLAVGVLLSVGASRAYVWPNELVEASLTSLTLAMLVGWIHFQLFLLTGFLLPHTRLDRFLNGYLAPSAVITAFAFLLLPFDGSLVRLVLTACALSLLSFPLLYRWVVGAAFAEIQQQVMVARSLGASWFLILTEVVWPQTAPAILRASGLAAVWGCGDFAISGILLQDTSLPLLISDLIGTYRIEQAQPLLLPLLVLSILVFAVFRGAQRYVAS